MDFVSHWKIVVCVGCLMFVGCEKSPTPRDLSTSKPSALAPNPAPTVSPEAAPSEVASPEVARRAEEATAGEAATIVPASYSNVAASLDTSWIAEEYFAAVLVHPRQILAKQPVEGDLREWLDAAATDLGVSLDDVEQVAFLLGPPDAGPRHETPTPMGTAWIFRFASDAGREGMLQRFLGNDYHRQATYQGHVYYKAESAPMSLCAPDERTVMLAPERTIKKVLVAEPARSALLTRLNAVEGRPDVVGAVHAAPVRPLLRQVLESAKKARQEDESAGPTPLWVRQLADLSYHLQQATLTVDLAEPSLARLTMEAENSQSAVRLEELAQGYRGTASLLLAAFKGQWTRGEQGQHYAPLFALVSETLSGVRTSRTVRQVTVEAPAPRGLPHLAAMLNSAFTASARGAARQERVRRMQLLGLALHNHHVERGAFPPGATRDIGGRPLLSWRVHLLPWLGEEELYRQFHLNEPWDSPHNLALAARMPAAYQSPGASADGRTRFVAVLGEGTPFALSRGAALRDFTDGPENTILLVECAPDRAVPWTRPDDLPFDPRDPAAALGPIDPEGFLALFGDGRVEAIQAAIDPASLAGLLTHAGGESSLPTGSNNTAQTP